MTGLENIINQIRQDAEEAARGKIAEAESAAQEILDDAKRLCEKRSDEIRKTGDIKKADLLERAKSAAQLDGRKELLLTKQRLIAEAVGAAQTQLENLAPAQYFDVLQKLAAKYATAQPGEMRLSEADLLRLPPEFAVGLPKTITISKTPADIRNGFLLIYGGIDVNCSFDALFADAAEDLQDLAAGILFS